MARAAGRFDYLDGLRGLACLMVVFYHSAVNIGVAPWVIWGYTGVHLFFVLSGFLLAAPFLDGLVGTRAFPSVTEFWKRRFVRIFPPFFVSLLVFIALRVVTKTNIPDLPNVLIHLVLLNNYVSDKEFYSINGVYWTLAVEMQYYLLLPLLALLVKRSTPRGAASARLLVGVFVVLGILARAGEFTYFHSIGNGIKFKTIFSFLDFFAVGMLCSAWRKGYLGGFAWVKARSTVVLTTALVGLVLVNRWASVKENKDWLSSPSLLFTVVFPLLVCVFYGLILLAFSVQERGAVKVITSRFLVFVGHLSYTIYLYHIGIQQVIIRVVHLESRIPDWQTMVFVYSLLHLGPILLGSALLFRLIEKPTLDYLERMKQGEGKS